MTVASGGSITIGTGVLNPLPSSGTGATINVPQFPQGLMIDLDTSGTFSGGTTFNVGQGATVDLTGGTYTGGVVFNVAQGATVDLTGGQTVTYSGTLTGSGAGTVQFGGGTLAVGWRSDAEFRRQHVPVDRRRRWHCAGRRDQPGNDQPRRSQRKGFYTDGTFDNYGTIIQTGTGNSACTATATPRPH